MPDKFSEVDTLVSNLKVMTESLPEPTINTVTETLFSDGKLLYTAVHSASEYSTFEARAVADDGVSICAPFHSHSTIEVFTVVSGGLCLHIDSEDTKVSVRAGESYAVPSGVPHGGIIAHGTILQITSIPGDVAIPDDLNSELT